MYIYSSEMYTKRYACVSSIKIGHDHKYHEGRLGNGIWTQSSEKVKCFFAPVKNRSVNALFEMFSIYLASGSTIIPDC